MVGISGGFPPKPVKEEAPRPFLRQRELKSRSYNRQAKGRIAKKGVRSRLPPRSANDWQHGSATGAATPRTLCSEIDMAKIVAQNFVRLW
jgi:hypothetical protein